MIRIGGSARRNYLFPAPHDATFRFHADLDTMMALLPHIEVLGAPSRHRRYLCYHATEAGLYEVRIYCAVIIDADARHHRIEIRPGADAATERCGFRSMSGSGRYASTIAFRPEGGSTRVDYALTIDATLPTPTSLLFLPAAVLNARAGRRFQDRLDEILDGFVRRSIDAWRQRQRAEGASDG